MNRRPSENRLRLALKMTLLFYVFGHLLILMHELGHGFAALLLGGYFPFVQIDAEGGRSIYMFAFGEPLWKQGVVMLAGPAVNFMIPLALLAYLRLTKPQGEARLVATLTGAVSSLMLVTASGLFPFWEYGYKEIGQGLIFLGIPSYLHQPLKIAWLAFGIALIAVFFRRFFAQMRQRFPGKGYAQALKLVTVTVALPVAAVMAFLSAIMLASGYGEGVITTTRHTPHIVFLIATYLLLPLIVPNGVSESLGKVRVTAAQLKAYGTLAVVFAVGQAVLFGHDRIDPNGIFLGDKPPEVDVAACNVHLSVEENLRARVLFLMRPYVDRHEFLWDRVKESPPGDWTHYERFMHAYLPAMLGTPDFRIVERQADPEVRFFNEEWKPGARIVEAEVDLSGSRNLARRGEGYQLTFVDSWMARGLGYVDFASISLSESFHVVDVSYEPKRANPPEIGPRGVSWENTDFGTSPRRVTVTFR